MDKLYTIKEIASILNIPESTLRYYRDRFEEFIPCVGKGRKRRYKEEAIDIFRLIINGYDQDLTFKQIKNQLLQTISKGNLEIESGAYENITQKILEKQGEILELLTKDMAFKTDIEKEIVNLDYRLKKIERAFLKLLKDYSFFKRQISQRIGETFNYKEKKNGE